MTGRSYPISTQTSDSFRQRTWSLGTILISAMWIMTYSQDYGKDLIVKIINQKIFTA